MGARVGTSTAEETVRKEWEAWDRHDKNAIGAFYAEDAVIFDPQYEQPLRGRESIRKDAEDFLKAFPDISFHVSNVLASGENCGFEIQASGTHKGPMVGPGGSSIPATNKRMQMKAGIFCRVNEQGLVTEEHRYYDLAGLLGQLGIQP